MNYSYESVRDILTSPKVSGNFKQMLKLGRTAYHEAAFAVYDSDDSASIEVSKLVVPKLGSQDALDHMSDNQHKYVDIDELIYRAGTQDDPYEIAARAHVSDNYAGFSDKAQRIVKNIQIDPEMDRDAKINLIIAALVKDLANNKAADLVVRDDVALLAHSHPMTPGADEPLATLLGPSEADVEVYGMIGHDYIDAIVAGDRLNQALMMYSAAKDTDIAPGAYNHDFASSRPGITSALARAGFVVTFLDLNKDGILKNGQSRDLREFVEATRSS